MELPKLRESWEKGQTPLFFVQDNGRALVILLSKSLFTCHRYVSFGMVHGQGEKWDVSVDHRDVTIEVALAWLQEKLS